VAVVLGHGQAQFHHRGASVGEKALPESRVGPGLRYDTCAIARQPLFLRQVTEFVDALGGFEAAGVEGGLDCVDAVFERSSSAEVGINLGHVNSCSFRHFHLRAHSGSNTRILFSGGCSAQRLLTFSSPEANNANCNRKFAMKLRHLLPSRRAFVFVCCLAFASAAFAQVKISIASLIVNSSYLPLWVAQEEGIFARHGVEADIKILPSAHTHIGREIPFGVVGCRRRSSWSPKARR
jgi:hypothetical protein